MELSRVKYISIPEGNVKKIEHDGNILWQVYIIPQGYRELQYIECDGRQYLDTTIAITNSTKITADIQFTAINREQLNGMHWTNNQGFAFGVVPNLANNKFVALVGNAGIWSGVGTLDTQKHKFVLQRSGNTVTFSVDGTYETKNGGVIPLTTYIIGGRRNGNLIDDWNYSRIYSVQIDSRRNFIPCKRLSDNKVGMYDTVSKSFFTSSTSVDFIAGPEI